jgi:glycerophosphoryl diester phosphodiesterase
MLNRITFATILTLLVGLFAVGTASAAPDRAPIPPPTDYWQDQGFILMAHQGGEWDFPPNTMFSYKSAIAGGADMIDMDAYVTKDGKLVLTHDLDARKNSNLTDDMFEGRHDINDLDLSELKTLDFAHKWSPHDGSSTTPFRGIATSTGTDKPPPPGFTRDDFKIPTFDEVLAAFPDTPINIELKAAAGVDEQDTAEEMASILASHPGHDENVIINSFGQSMLEKMHAARPQHLSFGGSLLGTLDYIAGEPIVPTPVAVEPPDLFNLPPVVRTVPVLKPFTDHDGYQIFVWGSGIDEAQDTPGFYEKLVDEGADSYNTPSPTTLAKYLCENGVARPDGSPRCDEQICPEGQTGIAPDNCVDIPPTTLSKVAFGAKKGKIKAGKKTKVTIRVSANDSGLPAKARIYLKSSNKRVKLPKSVVVTLRPGGTVKKTVTVRATGKARGKAKLTASAGKKKGFTTLTIRAGKDKAGSAHK